ERPALVASGVNHGSNLGDDVTYSGTVSAAMEGTLLSVPSIAVSMLDGGDLAAAGRAARLVAMRVLVQGLPPKTLLNVNVPPGTPRGLRFTRLGHRVYSGKIVEHVDPRGRTSAPGPHQPARAGVDGRLVDRARWPVAPLVGRAAAGCARGKARTEGGSAAARPEALSGPAAS